MGPVLGAPQGERSEGERRDPCTSREQRSSEEQLWSGSSANSDTIREALSTEAAGGGHRSPHKHRGISVEGQGVTATEKHAEGNRPERDSRRRECSPCRFTLFEMTVFFNGLNFCSVLHRCCQRELRDDPSGKNKKLK